MLTNLLPPIHVWNLKLIEHFTQRELANLDTNVKVTWFKKKMISGDINFTFFDEIA